MVIVMEHVPETDEGFRIRLQIQRFAPFGRQIHFAAEFAVQIQRQGRVPGDRDLATTNFAAMI